MNDWKLAWDKSFNKTGIVIAQNLDMEDHELIKFQTDAAYQFLKTQNWKQPSLLYVDEGHDFFGPTGMAKEGTIIQKCYRAGAEQGMATLLGIQRPKGVNLQLLTESNVMYCFYFAFSEDMKRLREMGVPEFKIPEEKSYEFRFYKNGKLYPNEVKMKLER